MPEYCRLITEYAPVAQWIRAFGCGPKGRGFESLQAHTRNEAGVLCTRAPALFFDIIAPGQFSCSARGGAFEQEGVQRKAQQARAAAGRAPPPVARLERH